MDPGNAPAARGLDRAVGTRPRYASPAPGMGMPGGFIRAKLLAAAPISGAHHRWVYTWAEVVAVSPGVYETFVGGRTSVTHGLAYNSMEANNSDSGVQGSGEDMSLLDGSDFAPVALGTGGGAAVVKLFPMPGDPTWWEFEATNITTGTCPEPEGGGE